jgi:hypothetical protein
MPPLTATLHFPPFPAARAAGNARGKAPQRRLALDWRALERGEPRIEALQRTVAAAQRGCAPSIAITLCDWRLPGIDPDSSAFVTRLAAVAQALARALAPVARAPLSYAPIDEIAFLAYALADTALLRPWRHGGCSRVELERNLVRAAVAACAAIRAVDPRARLFHTEPLVRQGAGVNAASLRALHANVDRIAGRVEPALGGDPRFIDALGLVLYTGPGADAADTPAGPSAHDVARALAARHGCAITIIERHATDLAWTPSSCSPTSGGISCASARSTSSHGWHGTGASCTSRSPCSTPAIRGPSCVRRSPG